MSKPLSHAQRGQIVRLREKGQPYHLIAEQVGCSPRSAQRIWSRYRQTGGAGLETRYHLCGRKSRYSPEIWEKAAEVRDHGQGASYVRSVLLESCPSGTVPHERSIQRKWAAQGQNRPKGRPKKRSTWSSEPGHTFQIDGKDQIGLKTGDLISWMKVADEASGADLATQLFFLPVRK